MHVTPCWHWLCGLFSSVIHNQQEVGRIRAETAENVSDKQSAAGVESDSMSAAETTDLAKGDYSTLEVNIATRRVTAAIKGCGTGAAVFGGIVSAITNGMKLSKCEVSVGEAGKTVAVDTVCSGARGAAMAALAEGITIGAETVVKNGALRSFLRGSAPIAAVGCAWDLVKDGVQDKLTTKSATTSVSNSTFTYGGAEAGAVVGTMVFPGVGTAVGSILGGLVAGYIFKQRKQISAFASNTWTTVVA